MVLDASVLIDALVDDSQSGLRSRDAIKGTELAAPAIIDFEVLSAFRRLAHAPAFTKDRLDQAVDDLKGFPVTRVLHAKLIGRIWDLRENLTTYDAAYVALAEQLDVPLLTADQRIAAAPGPKCEIRLLAEY
ncbi:MAG: type II toxin-antitoxin system VapC family toxin [Solirubrobacterales bacterium]